jgi:hypothetical protein
MKIVPFVIIHVLQGIFGIQYILFCSIQMYLSSLTEHYATLRERCGNIIAAFPTSVCNDVFNVEKTDMCSDLHINVTFVLQSGLGSLTTLLFIARILRNVIDCMRRMQISMLE